MDLSTLIDGLTSEFAALATTAAIADQSGLFWRAANNAYTMMGLDPTNPATVLSTQQALDAPWLAEYFALRSIVRGMVGMVDTRSPNQEAKWSQGVKAAQALLAEAQASVESRGYAITANYGYGRLDLDYLEPYYAPGVSNWTGY